jgi:hypothetical protein
MPIRLRPLRTKTRKNPSKTAIFDKTGGWNEPANRPGKAGQKPCNSDLDAFSLVFYSLCS